MSDSPKAKSIVITSRSDKPPLVSRSKFFFDDSMIHIEIENVQFKVHKSELIKSETFADMFVVADSSNNGDGTMEGTSTDHPIKLEGVSASDFEYAQLMSFFNFGRFKGKQANRDLSLLLPAFRLAHMWNFTELRATLLPMLERSLNDVDKIVYAREFGIEGWITPAYIKLYRREEPLSTEEAEKIGFTSAMLIFRLREERYSASYQQCCGQTPKIESRTVNLQTRCDSYGTRGTANSNATDKAIEERINTWEKGGQVFTK